MVLSNIAHLIDVHPRELTDWFHVAFIDAYDWVVEPNVLGMGTLCAWFSDDDKALHCGLCLHQPDEQPLQKMRVPPEENLSDFSFVLGLPRPPFTCVCR